MNGYFNELVRPVLGLSLNPKSCRMKIRVSQWRELLFKRQSMTGQQAKKSINQTHDLKVLNMGNNSYNTN